LAMFFFWIFIFSLSMLHGSLCWSLNYHMDMLRVYLSNYMVGKYVIYFVDKGNKMINSDMLLGVILNQTCNYISSSLI
jgi:hypothetical protein